MYNRVQKLLDERSKVAKDRRTELEAQVAAYEAMKPDERVILQRMA